MCENGCVEFNGRDISRVRALSTRLPEMAAEIQQLRLDVESKIENRLRVVEYTAHADDVKWSAQVEGSLKEILERLTALEEKVALGVR